MNDHHKKCILECCLHTVLKTCRIWEDITSPDNAERDHDQEEIEEDSHLISGLKRLERNVCIHSKNDLHNKNVWTA